MLDKLLCYLQRLQCYNIKLYFVESTENVSYYLITCTYVCVFLFYHHFGNFHSFIHSFIHSDDDVVVVVMDVPACDVVVVDLLWLPPSIQYVCNVPFPFASTKSSRGFAQCPKPDICNSATVCSETWIRPLAPLLSIRAVVVVVV